VSTTATVLDGISTVNKVESGLYVEKGSPYLYGTKPTAASYFGPALAIEVGLAFTSYRLQHSRSKSLRMIGHGLMGYKTYVHLDGFIHNVRIHAPAQSTQSCMQTGACHF